jgi:hypothetical protein
LARLLVEPVLSRTAWQTAESTVRFDAKGVVVDEESSAKPPDGPKKPLTVGELAKSMGAAQSSLAKQFAGFAAAVPVQLPQVEIPPNPNLASEFYRRLADWIKRFDESLDEDHEVGVRLVNFGQSVTFHLEDMGYWNPSLISFKGATPEGDPVELIQHVSQISILLLTMKRPDPRKPRRRVGFAPWEDDGEEQS